MTLTRVQRVPDGSAATAGNCLAAHWGYATHHAQLGGYKYS